MKYVCGCWIFFIDFVVDVLVGVDCCFEMFGYEIDYFGGVEFFRVVIGCIF